MLIQLICQAPHRAQELEQIAARWQLQASDDSPFALVLSEERLELRKLDEPKLGAIYVDWVEVQSHTAANLVVVKGNRSPKRLG